MARIFREEDALPELLRKPRIAILGYGNQGRSQALNLRDSGARILVGNIDDDYRQQALDDGFEVRSIPDAVSAADLVMILIPDEICAKVFARDVSPNLKPGDAICFASGYNVAFGQILCPDGVDLLLLAPRMIGLGVRDLYLKGDGFYSFVAVERDATGAAWDLLLALAWGIGTLRKGAVEVTFAMEAELDLFNEQAFGPAFGRVLLTSIKTLIDAGYPKEAVLLEIYMSGELGFILGEMAKTGAIKQLDYHSQTSQYGAMSRGIKFLGVNLARPMRKILEQIRSGRFAREWHWEQRLGKPRYRFFRAMAVRQPIGKLEAAVRKQLGEEM